MIWIILITWIITGIISAIYVLIDTHKNIRYDYWTFRRETPLLMIAFIVLLGYVSFAISWIEIWQKYGIDDMVYKKIYELINRKDKENGL